MFEGDENLLSYNQNWLDAMNHDIRSEEAHQKNIQANQTLATEQAFSDKDILRSPSVLKLDSATNSPSPQIDSANI